MLSRTSRKPIHALATLLALLNHGCPNAHTVAPVPSREAGVVGANPFVPEIEPITNLDAGSDSQVSCTRGTPTLEVCDGVDNDCNGTVDNDIAASCSGQTLLACSGGRMAPQQDCALATVAHPDGQACSGSACVGNCVSGRYRCNATTKNPEVCQLNGEWLRVEICTAPGQMCRSTDTTSASCQPNQPYEIGDGAVDPSWGNLFTLEDTIYFRPIVAPQLATLQFFRLVGHPPADDTAGICQMAIYTDAGGRPGTLLTWNASSIPVIDGVGGAGPSSSGIRLNGTYWVGAECFHPSGSATLRAKALTGAQYIRGTHTFGTEFPTTWPANMGTRVTGTALAFFLQVQNVP